MFDSNMSPPPIPQTDPRAGYLLLDTAESTVTWLRAEYDIRSAQAAIRDAGLPLRLAARLAEGR